MAADRYTGDHFDQLANVSAAYPSFGILATEAAEAGDQTLSPTGGTWAFVSAALAGLLCSELGRGLQFLMVPRAYV